MDEGRISLNSVALAGEFAVLSRLALLGYDANMTLGHTKSVDILVSDPKTERMYKLEVKTNYTAPRKVPAVSRIHGAFINDWMMGKKHETIKAHNLFYCFVNISKKDHLFRFFIVPSKVVARYIKEEHALWLKEKAKLKSTAKDTDMRLFRVGLQKETYPISTPTAEQYEDNWEFKI